METRFCATAWFEIYRQSPYAVGGREPECWGSEESSTRNILYYRVRAATKEAAACALDQLQPPGSDRVREDTLALLEGDGSGANETIWFGSRAVAVESGWTDS